MYDFAKINGMIRQAKTQQELTGKEDAAVSFVIRGSWPLGNKKRLAGRAGPLGECICEYEDAVLCVFKADAVIAFLKTNAAGWLLGVGESL